MHNARNYDERITIGGVPTPDDLAQLAEIGFRTVVDLRDEEEKFGGTVEKKAEALGLGYLSIPVVRRSIDTVTLDAFYHAVFRRGTAPLYVFSRYGKRPLALLLLLEAIARGKPVLWIFQKAAEFGLNLEGDECLHTFLVKSIGHKEIATMVDSIQLYRPDLPIWSVHARALKHV
jgi:uncharacterized protein (TIGR01244 family)